MLFYNITDMKKCIFLTYSSDYAKIIISQTSTIWSLTVIYDNKELLNLLSINRYDFFLFDVDYVDNTKFELIKQIRIDYPKLKIFILVHNEFDEMKDKFLECDVDGVFNFYESYTNIDLKIESFFCPPLTDPNNSILNETIVKTLSCTIVGFSQATQELRGFISRAASYNLPILLLGETGCGKGLAAKLIHELDSTRKGKFIAVNLGCIPEALAESVLFGTEKGAFTDAEKKEGLFEAANGGTLFLDEMQVLSMPLQAKFLHAIETKQIYHVGSIKPHEVDFKLICATNEDLKSMVFEKRFRQDLFYRLDVIRHTILPLRKRKEDIKPLVLYFLKSKNKKITPAAMQKLHIHSWAGNVRELENCIQRACYNASQSDVIEASDIEF